MKPSETVSHYSRQNSSEPDWVTLNPPKNYLEIRICPRFFSILRNHQAESRYLQYFLSYRVHTHISTKCMHVFMFLYENLVKSEKQEMLQTDTHSWKQ